jgi:hypothetical protein
VGRNRPLSVDGIKVAESATADPRRHRKRHLGFARQPRTRLWAHGRSRRNMCKIPRR